MAKIETIQTQTCPQVRCRRRFPTNLIRTTMATLPRQPGNRTEAMSVTLCPLCMEHFERLGVLFNDRFTPAERAEAEQWIQGEHARSATRLQAFMATAFRGAPSDAGGE